MIENKSGGTMLWTPDESARPMTAGYPPRMFTPRQIRISSVTPSRMR